MSRISFLLIGISVMILFKVGSSEIYKVLDDMEKLLEKEIVLIDNFHTYIQNQEHRLLNLRSNVEDYSRKLEVVSHSLKHHLSNTINSNLLVKGLMTDWKTLEELLVENNPNSNTTSLNSEEEEITSENYDNESRDKKYQMLCNEKIPLPAHIQKQLKCRYVDHDTPFLKIAPFKVEEAYLKPRIVIFHDVIHDEEIETLKRLSKPKLQKAKLISDADEAEVAKIRIAESAWLQDTDHKHVEDVRRRVEHMTRLTIDTAESLQIGYYKIGGFYNYHVDFLNDELNDVEQGGETIFIELNVTLTPKKGSAAFWYNLKPNGKGDYLTIHGACAVQSGSKLVANQWLHAAGQEFLRPCILENQ